VATLRAPRLTAAFAGTPGAPTAEVLDGIRRASFVQKLYGGLRRRPGSDQPLTKDLGDQTAASWIGSSPGRSWIRYVELAVLASTNALAARPGPGST